MRKLLSQVGICLCTSPLHVLPTCIFNPLFTFACYLSKF